MHATQYTVLLRIGIAIPKVPSAFQQDISIHPHTPPHHVRRGRLAKLVAVIANVAQRLGRTGRAVVVEQRGLHREAGVAPVAAHPLAEEAHGNVEGVADIPERNLVQDLPRGLLRDRVAQGTHAFLDVVRRPRVLGILVLQREGVVQGPQISPLGDGHVVVVDYTPSRDRSWAAGGWEVHPAVANPEDVPVIPIRREPGR